MGAFFGQRINKCLVTSEGLFKKGQYLGQIQNFREGVRNGISSILKKSQLVIYPPVDLSQQRLNKI